MDRTGGDNHLARRVHSLGSPTALILHTHGATLFDDDALHIGACDDGGVWPVAGGRKIGPRCTIAAAARRRNICRPNAIPNGAVGVGVIWEACLLRRFRKRNRKRMVDPGPADVHRTTFAMKFLVSFA